MSWQPGIYRTPKGYWVRVGQGSGEWYRPGTNDFDFYHEHKLGDWKWRSTRTEAQTDLDALASRIGLEAVTKEIL